MRQFSRGFSPPANAVIRSARLSIGALTLVSVRWVIWRWRLAPVPGKRHIGGERGDGRGLLAQDAGPERDRDCAGRRADHGPLFIGKAAFGAGEDGRRSRLECFGRALAAAFVREIEFARTIATLEQLLQRRWLVDLGQARPAALLGGFDCDRLQPLEPNPLSNGALSHYGQKPSDAELGRLLHQPIGLRAFDWREGEPNVHDLLRFTRAAIDSQRPTLFAALRDARQPFARMAIEEQQLVAHPEPQDIAEVICLSGVQLDGDAVIQRLPDEQARQAFRRPGRDRGHGVLLRHRWSRATRLRATTAVATVPVSFWGK